MEDTSSLRSFEESGVDVTPDSALPDIPDAGADSVPISPPEPVDISTATLTTDATIVATTLDDGDPRTLYEQAIDAYETSDGITGNTGEQMGAAGQTTGRRVRIYDASA